MQNLQTGMLVVFFLFFPAQVSAQAINTDPLPNDGIERIVKFLGYPHSMLFHNAFYGENSTRFLLLKASLQSSDVANGFQFTKEQLDTIRELSPVESGAKPDNDSIDEQAIDPNFYSFLSDSQLTKLDALAIRFDGLAALMRISLKNRLGISEDSITKIREIVDKIRKEVLLRFRMNFAAVLPADQTFRDVDYSGRLLTHVNERILQSLTPEERLRLFEFLREHFDHKLIKAVEELAPLPEGLGHLIDDANR